MPNLQRTSAVTSLLAATLACALPARAQQPALFPSAVYPMSGAVDRLLSADLNLDGRPDYVSTQSLNMIGVYLGTASGGIGPSMGPASPSTDFDLAIGLLAGDAWPDLVTANELEFRIRRGAGGGTFLAPESLPTDMDARLAGLADMNGDGLADLVSGEWKSGPGFKARVRLASGGSFGAPLDTTLPGIGDSVLLAPLDGDTTPDAVFVDSLAAHVCRGSASGALLAPTTLVLPTFAQGAAIADLDGDGELDLAISCGLPGAASGRVVVRIGDGAGGFSAAPDLALPADPGPLRAADLDTDGDTDLVASCGVWTCTLERFQNPGNGAFPASESFVTPEALTGLVIAEASGDGRLDAVTSHSFGVHLSILAGDGAGGWAAPARLLTWHPVSLRLLDVDGDGALDMLVAHDSQPGYVGVAPGDGAGGFGEEVLHAADNRVNSADAGDLTGDGVSDGACATNKGVEVFRGLGSPDTKAPLLSSVNGLSTSKIILDELDGDGHLDALVTASTTTGPYSSFLVCLAGDGTGHLAVATSQPIAAGGLSDLERGDLDGDGRLDAVLFGSAVRVLRSLGAFAFAPPQTYALSGNSAGGSLGDLDLDGDLDVVARQGFKYAVLRGDGAGGLLPAQYTVEPGAYGESAIADVTGDGWPDLLLAEQPFASFAVAVNDGAGTLSSSLATFSASLQTTGLSVADINGDGRPDCATAGWVGDSQGGELVASLNLRESFTWTDLGSALPGTLGPPALIGTGTLVPGSSGQLVLQHARPLSPTALVIAAQSVPVAVKGGVVLASPPVFTQFLLTDGAGSLSVGWSAWPSSAPGEDWFFQCGVKDPAAVHGVALSNALKATEP